MIHEKYYSRLKSGQVLYAPQKRRKCVIAERDSAGYFRVYYPATRTLAERWGRYSFDRIISEFRLAKRSVKIAIPGEVDKSFQPVERGEEFQAFYPPVRRSRFQASQHRQELLLKLYVRGKLTITKRYEIR